MDRTLLTFAIDISNPGSFEDIVDLLVPELQKRGLYWNDYPVPGGTFRENMQIIPGKPYLPMDHPSAKFKWNAPQHLAEPEKHDLTEMTAGISEATKMVSGHTISEKATNGEEPDHNGATPMKVEG